MKFLMTLSDTAGFWTHRVQLGRAITARGWALILATEGAERDDRLAALGIRGAGWPAYKSHLSHFAILSYLYRLIRSERPDIVHAVTLRQSFYMALATRYQGRDIPSVFTVAGLGSLFSLPTPFMRMVRPFVMTMLRCAFARKNIRVIFQNDDDRAQFLHARIVPPEKTVLIRGSGVDLTAFSFHPVPEDARPVVLFGGRLLADKGVYDLAEAARILKARGVPCRVVLAGDVYPKNPHSLAPETVQGWVREGIVEWSGAVTDMGATLCACTLAVLPSYREGVPKFLLEAAATGRAIVTTDVPGCRDVVRHGENGLLVPARDAAALADAIETLLSDAPRRAAMGAAGRRRMEDSFGVESVVSATMAVYDDLLQQKDAP